MSGVNKSKQTAGKKAIDFIESGMVIGLGTGSTFRFALEELGARLKSGRLANITCVASSLRTERKAKNLGITLSTFEHIKEIDVTIDGADEVDQNLNLIKGGGGAMLREKILAQNSKRMIVITDDSKISRHLGEKWSVPVEVLPFAWQVEDLYLKSIGGKGQLRKTEKGQIYLTDQKNFVLDCNFGIIKDPERIALLLEKRAGILGHGLFLHMATDLIVGKEENWRHISVRS